MKTLERSLCLAVPENADRSLISAVADSIRNHAEFRHYDVHVLELPHDRGAVFKHELTSAFVEASRHYGTLAFLSFPDGSIHFAHGEAITDKWRRQHDSHVYQVNIDGEVTRREPLNLFGQILSRGQTLDHVWDPSQHYMRPLLH